MNIDDIHSLAHKHLDTSGRQELASWLLMESRMQPSDDEYYEQCARELERRKKEEADQWKLCLAAFSGAVSGGHR